METLQICFANGIFDFKSLEKKRKNVTYDIRYAPNK